MIVLNLKAKVCMDSAIYLETVKGSYFPLNQGECIKCWIKVPSMIGKKNIRSCFQIIPSVIAFISIVFFPKF